MARHIEAMIIGKSKSLEKTEEEEMRGYFKQLTPQEKANTLYEKLMAYDFDKRAASRNFLPINSLTSVE